MFSEMPMNTFLNNLQMRAKKVQPFAFGSMVRYKFLNDSLSATFETSDILFQLIVTTLFSNAVCFLHMIHDISSNPLVSYMPLLLRKNNTDLDLQNKL